MMRVSLDCIIFGLQRVGGISTYWHQLAAALAAEPTVDLRLTLPRAVASADPGALAALSGPALRGRLPDSVGRYLNATVAADTELAHSSYYRLPVHPTARRVVTVYDFTYERYRRGAARWLHSTQKAHAIRAADGIVCISAAVRAELIARFPGVDADRVAAIPLAVSPLVFAPLAPPLQRPELADCLLFVGARGGYKRFDLAVAGVAAVPDLRLATVGGPPSPAERRLLDAALGRRWIDLGLLDPVALRTAYASAYALVYPSDSEGFGLPLLEAMACGCPVVAANTPITHEVGGSSVATAPTQCADAYRATIEALRHGRAARVAAGLVQAATFSWQRTADETLGFYHRTRVRAPVGGGRG